MGKSSSCPLFQICRSQVLYSYLPSGNWYPEFWIAALTLVLSLPLQSCSSKTYTLNQIKSYNPLAISTSTVTICPLSPKVVAPILAKTYFLPRMHFVYAYPSILPDTISLRLHQTNSFYYEYLFYQKLLAVNLIFEFYAS